MNSNPGQGKYLYVDEGHLDYRERTEKDPPLIKRYSVEAERIAG
jgi:hypothetical protein